MRALTEASAGLVMTVAEIGPPPEQPSGITIGIVTDLFGETRNGNATSAWTLHGN